MKKLASWVLVFTGLLLIIIGVIVHLSLPNARIRTNLSQEAVNFWINYGFIGIMAGVGGLLILIGIIGIIRVARRNKLNLLIMQTGTDAEGNVTFVDKNYRITVNRVPVYSIVEYHFKDHSGNTFMRRVDTVPSEMVIRSGIVVGSKVKIKYLPANPNQNVIVLQ